MASKIGHILDTSKESKFIMTDHVGEGRGILDNGQEINYELLSAMDRAPVIKYGKKYFLLSWEDILNLAEKKGLFEKEGKNNE